MLWTEGTKGDKSYKKTTEDYIIITLFLRFPLLRTGPMTKYLENTEVINYIIDSFNFNSHTFFILLCYLNTLSEF